MILERENNIGVNIKIENVINEMINQIETSWKKKSHRNQIKTKTATPKA